MLKLYALFDNSFPGGFTAEFQRDDGRRLTLFFNDEDVDRDDADRLEAMAAEWLTDVGPLPDIEHKSDFLQHVFFQLFYDDNDMYFIDGDELTDDERELLKDLEYELYNTFPPAHCFFNSYELNTGAGLSDDSDDITALCLYASFQSYFWHY